MTESEPRASKGQTGDDHKFHLVHLNKMLEEEYTRITKEIEGLSRELGSYFDHSRPASARLEGVLPQRAEGARGAPAGHGFIVPAGGAPAGPNSMPT